MIAVQVRKGSNPGLHVGTAPTVMMRNAYRLLFALFLDCVCMEMNQGVVTGFW